MTLREHLIGAWELTYYAEQLGPDGPIAYLHGENPNGLIVSTPDGYMSAQIMTPGRRWRVPGERGHLVLESCCP